MVYIWDAASRHLLYKLPGHSGSVNEAGESCYCNGFGYDSADACVMPGWRFLVRIGSPSHINCWLPCSLPPQRAHRRLGCQ